MTNSSSPRTAWLDALLREVHLGDAVGLMRKTGYEAYNLIHIHLSIDAELDSVAQYC